MHSATTSLRGHPPSVPEARRWTVTTLSAWGLDETAWSAAQVVSELATNCTLHARSDFVLRLSVSGESVRVEATDGAPGGLQPRSYSDTATTGRGLRIVETLASDWGVEASADGKTVWALLPLEDPPPPGADDDGDATAPAAPGPGGGPRPTGAVARGAAA